MKQAGSNATRSTLYHLGWILAPKAVGGLLLVLTNVLVMTFVDAGEFGLFTLCIASVLLVDALVGSAFDWAVLRLAPGSRGTDLAYSLGVEAAAFWLKLLLAALLGLVLLLTGDWLGNEFLASDAAGELIWFTFLAIVGTLVYRSAMVNLQTDESFVAYGVLEWCHLACRYGLAAICLVFVERSTVSVVEGFAVGTTVASLLSMGVVVRRHGFFRPFDRRHVRDLLNCVKWYLPSNGAGAARDRIDIFLLPSWVGMPMVGQYSAAKVASSALDLVSAYIAVVLAPRIMPRVDDGTFLPMFRFIQWLLVLCTGAGAIAVLLFTGPVVEHWFPPQYRGIEMVIILLLMGALSGLLVNPLAVPYVTFVNPRALTLINLLTLPSVMLAYIFVIPGYGIVGAAWVTALGRIIPALVVLRIAWSDAVSRVSR